MSTLTVAELKTAISEHWKNVPAGEAALKIIAGIEDLAVPATDWRMSEIMGLLDTSQPTPELLGAMGILTQSEHALFSSCADFVDEENNRHRLSCAAFQRVLNEDTLTHPVTGIDVAGASERVIPIFVLNAEVTW